MIYSNFCYLLDSCFSHTMLSWVELKLNEMRVHDQKMFYTQVVHNSVGILFFGIMVVVSVGV